MARSDLKCYETNGDETSYFEVNGDELMDEEPANEAPLSWRQDPNTTHSDWKIIVSFKKSESTETYHVHKNIISVGPRSCLYFATLFSSPTALPEKKDNTSRITLEQQDAEAFPLMLDFIYSVTGELDATTENAVALRSLARYFRCRELMKKVNEFIKKDLTNRTAVEYLRTASERNDDKVEESARKLIFDKYNETTPLDIVSLPTELFRSIVCSHDLCESSLERVAQDVVLFFDINPEALNAQLLNELTSRLTTSTVSVFETAEGLRSLIGQLDPEKEDEESWLALNNLCRTCAEVLAKDWILLDTDKHMKELTDPCFEGDFRGVGRLAVTLLGAALKEAKTDYERVAAENRQKDSTLTLLGAALKQAKTDYERAAAENRQKSIALRTLERQLQESEQTITTLKKRVKVLEKQVKTHEQADAGGKRTKPGRY